MWLVATTLDSVDLEPSNSAINVLRSVQSVLLICLPIS